MFGSQWEERDKIKVGWDTRKPKKQKSQNTEKARLEKLDPEGDIYFYNQDSSPPGTLPTEQVNPSIRLVTYKAQAH